MGSTTSSTAGLPKPASSSAAAPPDIAKISGRRGLLTGLASGNYGLADAVGAGRANRGRDVQVVENMLSRTGLLNRSPGKVFNEDTGQGIRKAQAEINKNFPHAVDRRPLKIDGWLRPDGPTAQATRTMARSTLKMDRDKTVRPATDLLSFRQPKSRRPWWKAQGFEEISGEAVAENGRQITALTKTADFGDLPKYVADALENAGGRGMAEVADLLRQFEALDPVRANELSGLTLERVSDATRDRVRELENEQGDPPHKTLELRTRDRFGRLIDPSKDAMPLPHREGQVWDNGRWRDMTPEELRRPDKINLADSGADGSLADGSGDDTPAGGEGDDRLEKETYPDRRTPAGKGEWDEDLEKQSQWHREAGGFLTGTSGELEGRAFDQEAERLHLDKDKADYFRDLYKAGEGDLERLHKRIDQVYADRTSAERDSMKVMANGLVRSDDPETRKRLIGLEALRSRTDGSQKNPLSIGVKEMIGLGAAGSLGLGGRGKGVKIKNQSPKAATDFALSGKRKREQQAFDERFQKEHERKDVQGLRKDMEKNPSLKIERSQSPIWNALKDAGRTNRKTNGRGKKERLFEWDSRHGHIEVYDDDGNHLGVIEPMFGRKIGGPVKGRTIETMDIRDDGSAYV